MLICSHFYECSIKNNILVFMSDCTKGGSGVIAEMAYRHRLFWAILVARTKEGGETSSLWNPRAAAGFEKNEQ